MSGECSKALLFCGTGVGISMAANKIKGIRACCCSDSFSCEYTRRHNDANALCMGGRVVGAGLACQLVDLFLNTEFEAAPSAPHRQADRTGEPLILRFDDWNGPPFYSGHESRKKYFWISRLSRPRRLSGQSPSICYRRSLACLKDPLGLSLLRNRRAAPNEFHEKGHKGR